MSEGGNHGKLPTISTERKIDTRREIKRRRDDEGLTPAMRRAVPIVATAQNVRQGVLECVRMGIVNSENYFWKTWNRDHSWREALNKARDEYQGAVRERRLSQFLVFDERINKQVLKNAQDPKRSDQIQWVKLYYELIGANPKNVPGHATIKTGIAIQGEGKTSVQVILPAKNPREVEVETVVESDE